MAAKDVVIFGLNIFLYKIISLSVISAENNYVVFSLFSKRSHTQAFYEYTTLRLLLSMTTFTYGNNINVSLKLNGHTGICLSSILHHSVLIILQLFIDT